MTIENTDDKENAVVILAAGKGTRMCSDVPKVLHPIAGAPMLHHAIRAALSLAPARLAVVVSANSNAVATASGNAVSTAVHDLAPDAAICEQADQLGTGHAVRMAEAALADFTGDVYVLYADTPFIAPDTLAAMAKARAGGADLVALGFDAADPDGYGRMITGPGDALERIVEEKDASAGERAIRLCNSGVMVADRTTLFGLLAQLGNDNAKGEYYLTDVIGLARDAGLNARVVRCDEAETLGINDRTQLAQAEAAFQARARNAAMMGGVTMTAPETVFLAWDTKLGRDVTIAPNVVFGPWRRGRRRRRDPRLLSSGSVPHRPWRHHWPLCPVASGIGDWPRCPCRQLRRDQECGLRRRRQGQPSVLCRRHNGGRAGQYRRYR